MSKDEKKGTGSSRRDLLDELSSIQSLLGDAAEDVAQSGLHDDDDIPTLAPSDAPLLDPLEGDAHTQIPLLGGESSPSKPTSTPKPPAERENPFLPKSTAKLSEQSRAETSKAIEALIAQRAPQTRTATPSKAPHSAPATPTKLDDRQVRALVDEVLSAWMPRIERELRNRLIEELKNKS